MFTLRIYKRYGYYWQVIRVARFDVDYYRAWNDLLSLFCGIVSIPTSYALCQILIDTRLAGDLRRLSSLVDNAKDAHLQSHVLRHIDLILLPQISLFFVELVLLSVHVVRSILHQEKAIFRRVIASAWLVSCISHFLSRAICAFRSRRLDATSGTETIPNEAAPLIDSSKPNNAETPRHHHNTSEKKESTSIGDHLSYPAQHSNRTTMLASSRPPDAVEHKGSCYRPGAANNSGPCILNSARDGTSPLAYTDSLRTENSALRNRMVLTPRHFERTSAGGDGAIAASAFFPTPVHSPTHTPRRPQVQANACDSGSESALGLSAGRKRRNSQDLRNGASTGSTRTTKRRQHFPFFSLFSMFARALKGAFSFRFWREAIVWIRSYFSKLSTLWQHTVMGAYYRLLPVIDRISAGGNVVQAIETNSLILFRSFVPYLMYRGTAILQTGVCFGLYLLIASMAHQTIDIHKSAAENSSSVGIPAFEGNSDSSGVSDNVPFAGPGSEEKMITAFIRVSNLMRKSATTAPDALPPGENYPKVHVSVAATYFLILFSCILVFLAIHWMLATIGAIGTLRRVFQKKKHIEQLEWQKRQRTLRRHYTPVELSKIAIPSIIVAPSIAGANAGSQRQEKRSSLLEQEVTRETDYLILKNPSIDMVIDMITALRASLGRERVQKDVLALTLGRYRYDPTWKSYVALREHEFHSRFRKTAASSNAAPQEVPIPNYGSARTVGDPSSPTRETRKTAVSEIEEEIVLFQTLASACSSFEEQMEQFRQGRRNVVFATPVYGQLAAAPLPSVSSTMPAHLTVPIRMPHDAESVDVGYNGQNSGCGRAGNGRETYLRSVPYSSFWSSASESARSATSTAVASAGSAASASPAGSHSGDHTPFTQPNRRARRHRPDRIRNIPPSLAHALYTGLTYCTRIGSDLAPRSNLTAGQSADPYVAAYNPSGQPAISRSQLRHEYHDLRVMKSDGWMLFQFSVLFFALLVLLGCFCADLVLVSNALLRLKHIAHVPLLILVYFRKHGDSPRNPLMRLHLYWIAIQLLMMGWLVVLANQVQAAWDADEEDETEEEGEAAEGLTTEGSEEGEIMSQDAGGIRVVEDTNAQPLTPNFAMYSSSSFRGFFSFLSPFSLFASIAPYTQFSRISTASEPPTSSPTSNTSSSLTSTLNTIDRGRTNSAFSNCATPCGNTGANIEVHSSDSLQNRIFAPIVRAWQSLFPTRQRYSPFPHSAPESFTSPLADMGVGADSRSEQSVAPHTIVTMPPQAPSPGTEKFPLLLRNAYPQFVAVSNTPSAPLLGSLATELARKGVHVVENPLQGISRSGPLKNDALSHSNPLSSSPNTSSAPSTTASSLVFFSSATQHRLTSETQGNLPFHLLSFARPASDAPSISTPGQETCETEGTECADESNPDDEEAWCFVCCATPADIRVFGCGHGGMCTGCAMGVLMGQTQEQEKKRMRIRGKLSHGGAMAAANDTWEGDAPIGPMGTDTEPPQPAQPTRIPYLFSVPFHTILRLPTYPTYLAIEGVADALYEGMKTGGALPTASYKNEKGSTKDANSYTASGQLSPYIESSRICLSDLCLEICSTKTNATCIVWQSLFISICYALSLRQILLETHASRHSSTHVPNSDGVKGRAHGHSQQMAGEVQRPGTGAKMWVSASKNVQMLATTTGSSGTAPGGDVTWTEAPTFEASLTFDHKQFVQDSVGETSQLLYRAINRDIVHSLRTRKGGKMSCPVCRADIQGILRVQ